MGNLPKDSFILLSFINMNLRDKYSNLEEFCTSYNVKKEDIVNKMKIIDYYYDRETNQFK